MIKRRLLFENVAPKKDVPIKKEAPTKKEVITKNKSTTKKETVVSDNKTRKTENWKSFDMSKPEQFVPCEFYVDKGTDKKDIFYGYVSHFGSICTNDPYNLVVMRKRYNNLFYRELGCESFEKCPNFFPDCKNCKKGNK